MQRHDISRSPALESAAPAKRKFKSYPLGHSYTNIAEVQNAQSRLYLRGATDRVNKLVFVELH